MSYAVIAPLVIVGMVALFPPAACVFGQSSVSVAANLLLRFELGPLPFFMPSVVLIIGHICIFAGGLCLRMGRPTIGSSLISWACVAILLNVALTALVCGTIWEVGREEMPDERQWAIKVSFAALSAYAFSVTLVLLGGLAARRRI